MNEFKVGDKVTDKSSPRRGVGTVLGGDKGHYRVRFNNFKGYDDSEGQDFHLVSTSDLKAVEKAGEVTKFEEPEPINAKEYFKVTAEHLGLTPGMVVEGLKRMAWVGEKITDLRAAEKDEDVTKFGGVHYEQTTVAPTDHRDMPRRGPKVPGSGSHINPTHYDFPGGVQVIDITKHLDFLTGNVVKYVCRAGRKDDRMTDLLKAKQYLDWLIEKEAE